MTIHLFKNELPDTKEWSSSYSGSWHSEFIHVLEPCGSIQTCKFSVSGGNKETPPTEETKRITGRVGRTSVSYFENCAWLYASDVPKLIEKAEKGATP